MTTVETGFRTKAENVHKNNTFIACFIFRLSLRNRKPISDPFRRKEKWTAYSYKMNNYFPKRSKDKEVIRENETKVCKANRNYFPLFSTLIEYLTVTRYKKRK